MQELPIVRFSTFIDILLLFLNKTDSLFWTSFSLCCPSVISIVFVYYVFLIGSFTSAFLFPFFFHPLQTRQQGSSFLADLKQKLLLPPSEAASAGTRYNVPLINSLVLYVGMQVLGSLPSKPLFYLWLSLADAGILLSTSFIVWNMSMKWLEVGHHLLPLFFSVGVLLIVHSAQCYRVSILGCPFSFLWLLNFKDANVFVYGSKAWVCTLTLTTVVQAIQQLQARSPHAQSTANTVTLAVFLVGAALDIFQTLIVELDTEGRYLFLNAVANQLRYPNTHTHYFSFVLLYLFAESTQVNYSVPSAFHTFFFSCWNC